MHTSWWVGRCDPKPCIHHGGLVGVIQSRAHIMMELVGVIQSRAHIMSVLDGVGRSDPKPCTHHGGVCRCDQKPCTHHDGVGRCDPKPCIHHGGLVGVIQSRTPVLVKYLKILNTLTYLRTSI